MKTPILFFILILFFFISCSPQTSQKQEKDKVEKKVTSTKVIKNFHRPPISFTAEGKIAVRYNIDVQTKILVNDRIGNAIIRYDYSKSGQLEKIAFLNKDSMYLDQAYLKLKYDSLNRISRKYYAANGGGKWGHESQYFYKENLVEKIVLKNWKERYGLSGPGMSKFSYDNKQRIIKEEFFNCNGEPAIVGEPGFKHIDYFYNANNQIEKEIYHYTGVVDPDAPAKNKWLTEYLYNPEGKLILSRYKFEIDSKDYDGITYFKYNEIDKLYGSSNDSSKITPNIPYQSIQQVVFQELYSDNFHQFPKELNFRN